LHSTDLATPPLGRPAGAFHFLPRAWSPTKGTEEPAGGGAPARKAATRRVLVVEDNLDSVHSLVLLLRQDGHQVDFAINGYAALEAAKRFRPDVVLLDLGLPGLDGFEVCRRLRRESELKDTRIIAVTAYARDEHRAKARAAGCDLHIIKPYDPQRLLAVVREL
jgi:CheY-like chemotaxis protein